MCKVLHEDDLLDGMELFERGKSLSQKDKIKRNLKNLVK